MTSSRTVAIAGASGLIGRALTRALRERGDRVLRLVRATSGSSASQASHDAACWDPQAGTVELDKLEGVDAVINLAGENIAAGRWTATRRRRILDSRVAGTETLVNATGRLESRPHVVINASATGIYGPAQQTPVDESAEQGAGFLAEVCAAWEAAAQPLAGMGIRLVCARFGVVLSQDGGALKKMLPAFRAGVGGRLGTGKQFFAWVSLNDAVRALLFAVDTPRVVGPINVVAPERITNATWTAALGRALKRPAALHVPSMALRLALGALADEALLGGQNVVPAALEEAGFVWHDPELVPFLAKELTAERS